MPKIIITIEDMEDGRIETHGEFIEPGKSYAEMTANPSRAVAIGIGLMMAIAEGCESYSGVLTDDDGTQHMVNPDAPLFTK